MTLRYDDIPPQLPKETPRVEADGSASEFLFESEAATNGWFLARAKDLNTRIFTVQDDVDGAYAAVTNEATARADADSALATDITTVSTRVDTNTADLVVLQGSYDGIAVKYAVTGTINGMTGGFQFSGVQTLDGTASYSIEFNVNDFKIFNPSLGTTTPVFNYNGTLNRFTFNAPVYIGETEIGTGASNDARALNYGSIAVGSGGSAVVPSSTVTITLTTKSTLLFSGIYNYAITGPTNGFAKFGMFVRVNGTNVRTAHTTGAVGANSQDTFINNDQNFTSSITLSPGTYTVDLFMSRLADGQTSVATAYNAKSYNIIIFRNVT